MVSLVRQLPHVLEHNEEEIEPDLEDSVDFQDPNDMDEATVNASQSRRRKPRGQRVHHAVVNP